MHYAYIIENVKQKKYYIGITNNPTKRWARHQSNTRSKSSKQRFHTYLYLAMRKYGIENFKFEVIKTFKSRETCEQFEINTIAWFKKTGVLHYNIHLGGTLGCNMNEHPNYEAWKAKLAVSAIGNSSDIQAKEAWKAKLRKQRKGRTPALGMKHTDEAKKIASKVSNTYWNTQETFARNPKKVKAILALSHREAKKQYGISTTHYYRLKKRFAINDSK